MVLKCGCEEGGCDLNIIGHLLRSPPIPVGDLTFDGERFVGKNDVSGKAESNTLMEWDKKNCYYYRR